MKEQKVIKKLFAFALISVAIIVVLKDAYNIENGWVHPETTFYHIKFLTNSTFEKFELSFSLEELEKLFWWEEVFDGSQNRILTGLFALVDIKFRPWLFQYIPPNPAVSLSWLLTLFFTPLLLYNFLRRYIRLDIIGSAAVTVLFIASPATVGNTFELFHPGKILAVFFYILALNIFMVVNNLALANKKNRTKQISFFILAALTLYLSLFTDPYIYAILFLIPVFLPKMFINPANIKHPGYCFKNNSSARKNIMYVRKILKQFAGFLRPASYEIYVIYGVVVATFFLTVFWALPQLANSAGYSYKFMQVFRHQIDSGQPAPHLVLLNWRYYTAILINIYWFVMANAGLGDFLPISMASLSNLSPHHWWPLLNIENTIIYSLFHTICWAFYSFFRNNYGLFRNVFTKIAACYLITAWITLVHGHYYFFVPYATFIYGSPFSIFFAIFAGAVLYSFRKNRKVHSILIIAVLTSAVFSYQDSKEMNRDLKGQWYGAGTDMDAIYRDSRQLWNDIKYNGKTFDQNLLKIDERIRNNYLKAKDPHDKYYVKIWIELSTNKEYLKAMHFAAFGKD